MELQSELQRLFPEIKSKRLEWATYNLDVTRQGEIYKPSRGLYKYKLTEEEEDELERRTEAVPQDLKEEDFYEPFAIWLKNENECTEAIAFGKNYFSKKWGTPDVIGTYKPAKRAVIQFQTEIVSAEIKLHASDPITAFGQAIAYRLFSSKVYLVEPSSMLPEDQGRIEALCMLFGIGFILFDLDVKNPNFTIRVRAQRSIPDMFYVNELANRLSYINEKAFEKLF